MNKLLYHTTNNLNAILASQELKSRYNLAKQNSNQIKLEYDILTNEIATYVKEYYKKKEINIPNLPNDEIAYISKILFYNKDKHNLIKNMITHKNLKSKSSTLDSLIKNSYVFLSNDLEYSAYFGNNNNEKFTLGIEINNNELEIKDYLFNGNLIWWQVPINKKNLLEVHTENPLKTEKILKSFNFTNTTIKDINYNNLKQFNLRKSNNRLVEFLKFS